MIIDMPPADSTALPDAKVIDPEEVLEIPEEKLILESSV